MMTIEETKRRLKALGLRYGSIEHGPVRVWATAYTRAKDVSETGALQGPSVLVYVASRTKAGAMARGRLVEWLEAHWRA